VTVVSERFRFREQPLPSGLETLWRAFRYTHTRVGFALTVLVVALAFVGPVFAPRPPSQFVGAPFQSPTAAAWLGTDYLGEDVLSRVLWGGRSVLWMAFAATSLGMLIGVSVGIVAAYSRSILDDILMRTMDVALAFPPIVLALLFVSFVGPKLWLIVVVVGCAWSPPISRVTRGAALQVVRREFVESAEVLGASKRRILFGEILPNIATPLLVEFGLRLTWSIALVAGISFLGFGIQPPNADWGLMINENRGGLVVQPWATLGPILCIAVVTIGTNLMAEGIARAIAGVDRKDSAEWAW
jgi:peptide/nickel transport system permease protein